MYLVLSSASFIKIDDYCIVADRVKMSSLKTAIPEVAITQLNIYSISLDQYFYKS